MFPGGRFDLHTLTWIESKYGLVPVIIFLHLTKTNLLRLMKGFLSWIGSSQRCRIIISVLGGTWSRSFRWEMMNHKLQTETLLRSFVEGLLMGFPGVRSIL